MAPLKEKTIPQLELIAETISSRLVSYVLKAYSEELNIKSITMWVDNQVVLYWITNKKLRKSFIQTKVDEIQNLIPTAEWKYVTSKGNPADLISRGTETEKFLKSELWFHGPAWVLKRKEWPQWSINSDSNIETNVSVAAVITENKKLNPLFDLQKYSCLQKILGVTGKVLLAISKKFCKEARPNLVEIEEKAEFHWITFIQNENYATEIDFCKNKQN